MTSFLLIENISSVNSLAVGNSTQYFINSKLIWVKSGLQLPFVFLFLMVLFFNSSQQTIKFKSKAESIQLFNRKLSKTYGVVDSNYIPQISDDSQAIYIDRSKK